MTNEYLKHIKLLRDTLAKVNGYADAAEMGDYFDFEDCDEVLMKQADDANKLVGVNIDDY
jgi:hypothetical protein